MCGGCVVEAPSPCPFHDSPLIRPSARLFVFSSGFVLVDGSYGWVDANVTADHVRALVVWDPDAEARTLAS